MSGKIGPNKGISITNNLIAYLDASRFTSYPGSGNIWYDLTFNQNNATLINGPTFNSNNGGSIVFDGTNDYAELTQASKGSDSSDFTWSIWFKPNIVSTQFLISRGKDDYGAGWSLFSSIQLKNGSYIFNLAAVISKVNNTNGYGYTAYDVYSTTSPVAGQWIYITGVYKKDAYVKVYVNGQFEASTALPASYTLRPSNKGWELGAFPGPGNEASSQTANGSIGLVAIYNKELSDGEILSDYIKTKNRFGL